MEHKTNHSEVARLLDTIEAEYQAAQRGLTGLAEVARHAFITARMEQIGALHQSLRALVGDASMPLMDQRLAGSPAEANETALALAPSGAQEIYL